VVNFQRNVHCLLGLPFDAVDLAGAVQRVRDAAAQRTPCLVSTPNLNFLIGCRTDSRFRDSVINSDLSIADGMPLVWIARLLRIPIPSRVGGADVFAQLGAPASTRLSVYFYGGKKGVAEAACRRLNAKRCALACVGFESPGFGAVEEMSGDETIARINASGADFVAVSLGAKKGQAWIERNRPRLSSPVICHLGAVMNFVAGTLRRAPAWMQASGLEWLWRIKEEPRLWRRYLRDGLALLVLLVTRVLPYAWYLHRHKPDADQPATARAEAREEWRSYVVRLRGAWTRRDMALLRDCFSKAALSGKDVKLDMGGVTYIDSAFLGLVVLLQGHQRRHDKNLLLVSLPAPVRRVIRYCCAEYLCQGADEAGGSPVDLDESVFAGAAGEVTELPKERTF
jgi:N-acetylglucosaminyldiphosphoundecaprenol N-acetyl-beta-D-mannosaminyltransferase